VKGVCAVEMGGVEGGIGEVEVFRVKGKSRATKWVGLE
jgi:hypothetical protein